MMSPELRATGRPVTYLRLGVAEVYAELGVAPSTFYDWRGAHKGPHCLKLPNGGVRVRRVELDSWLASLEERV